MANYLLTAGKCRDQERRVAAATVLPSWTTARCERN